MYLQAQRTSQVNHTVPQMQYRWDVYMDNILSSFRLCHMKSLKVYIRLLSLLKADLDLLMLQSLPFLQILLLLQQVQVSSHQIRLYSPSPTASHLIRLLHFLCI